MGTIFIVIGAIAILLLGAVLDGKRAERKAESIESLIRAELYKNNYNVCNIVWYEPYYIATDRIKKKIIIIKYDAQGCRVISKHSINFHTTTFLTNGTQINGQNHIIYPRNATLIFINNDEKKVLILSSNDINQPKELKFSDILSIELVMDSNVITKKSLTSTIGRTFIGGVIAGNVGAIVGGTTSTSSSQDVCKSLQIVITVREMNNPVIGIELCNCKEGIKNFKQSDVYKQALLLMKTFSVIIDSCLNTESSEKMEVNREIIKEIENLAKLKEQGIITNEEFIILKQRTINK